MPETEEVAVVETEVVHTPTVEELIAELDRTKKLNDALKKESISHRQKAKALEDEEERRKTEKLTEDEKLKKALAATQAQLRDIEAAKELLQKQVVGSKIERALEEELRKQDPEGKARFITVSKLVDYSQVEYDAETEKTVGAVDAIKKVLKEYPEIFGDGVRRGGGTPTRSDTPMPRPPSGGSRQTDVDPVRHNQGHLKTQMTYGL